MVAGHEWTGKEIVKLRRALHAVFVHRLDEGYARYLIDTKHAKLTEKLRTGSNFFKDTDGDMHELKTPLGTVADAATIAHMLLQIEAPYEPKQLISQQAETERFPDQLSIEAPKETKRFEKVEEIRRLRRENFNQSQIIQAIWKCKPGESQAYKDALAEYKQILQTIVQEGSQNVPMET